MLLALLGLLARLCFLATALAVARTDLLSFHIPDKILGLGAALTALPLLASTLLTSNWDGLNQGLRGAWLSCGAYLLLHLLTRGGIGFGDVKFALLIGLYTGWHSSTAAITALALAFVGAGLCGIGHLLTNTGDRHTEIPLAPWMALGAALAVAPADPLTIATAALNGTSHYRLG